MTLLFVERSDWGPLSGASLGGQELVGCLLVRHFFEFDHNRSTYRY